MQRLSHLLAAGLIGCASLLPAAAGGERTDRYGDPLPAGAIARLGTLRMRYGISDLCYAPDGAHALIVAGRELHLWDLARGERTGAWQVSGDTLRRLALSRDGRTALIADGAGRIAEWDLRQHRLAHQFATGRTGIVAVHYSPDERRVLTLDGGTATVDEWDRATGKRLIAIKAPESNFRRCVYGPGGTTVFVGARPATRTVCHYSLKTGKLLGSFAGNYGVHGMSLSPDGARLLVGTECRASEWQLDGYKRLRRFIHPIGNSDGGRALCVAYAPDGRHLVTGHRDGSILYWDRTKDRFLARWFPHQRHVTKIRVSPDGQWALSYGGDRLIAETNLKTGEPRLRWPRHLAAVHAVAFTPEGSHVVTGSADRTIRVWRTADWQAVRALQPLGSEVHCLAVSPDGARVAAGAKDGTVRELELATGTLRHTLRGHRGTVHAVAYAGGQVLSAADDGSLRLWDVASERTARVLEGHLGGVLALAVAPGGKRVLSGGRDGTVREWDVESGRLVRTVRAHRGPVETIAYGPDARCALSAGRDGLVIDWALPHWRPRRAFDHKAWVRDARYAAGGKYVCSAAGMVILWDRATGETVRKLAGHSGRIHSVAASPDGRWLVTGSGDSSALVWQVPDG